jgi:nucleoid-associated protein YgaU
MPNPITLAKAHLIELDVSFMPQSGGKDVTVQFNPETLKVSFTNQVSVPGGRRDESGAAAAQVAATGTSKLAVQLWFDVTAPLPLAKTGTTDVRRLTEDIIFFVTPRERVANDPPTAPPAVRFLWGSFQFDGLMDSVEETLEFFSDDGRPLRASVSLGISQTQTQKVSFAPGGLPGGLGIAGLPAGTAPVVSAQQGGTVQSIAAAAGAGADWQRIAAANGIENPRLLAPGQLINLRAR